MRKQNLLSVSIMALLGLTACGDQNPVKDIETLRAHGRNQHQVGPARAQIIEKPIVVEKPVEVIKEQAVIDSNVIVINPELNARFVEGQKNSLRIRAFVALKDVKTRLVARGLPEKAELKAIEKEENVYELSWTPSIGTVPPADAVKVISFKVALEILEAKDAKTRTRLEGLVREKEFPVLVLHDQTPPSELKIEGLGEEIAEGTETRFEVTVKVPGIDGSGSQRPQLRVGYDGGTLNGTQNHLELDGSRHVRIDVNQKEAVYLGESKWKFTMIFDTKTISVQPALSSTGAPLAGADTTHVRMTFKVFSPFGSATPEILKQVKIKHLNKVVTP